MLAARGIVLSLSVLSTSCASFRVGVGNIETERDALPIPEGIYAGACPFQNWYPGNLPDNFDMWQHIRLDGFRDVWNSSGSPTGVRLNDHNYETVLGQGNTLGFLAATLTLEGGPEHTKFGLFAHRGTLPAVVRLSDFGQDSSTFPRMTRVALKVPFESAWDGEVNLLFTETLDSFPIDDFNGLGVEGDYESAMSGQNGVFAGMRSGVTALGRAMTARTSETLTHSYYSQLPYALGSEQAAKISLQPRQITCGTEGADDLCCLPPRTQPGSLEEALAFARDRARVTAKYLAECDAVFDLKLQVKRYDESTLWVSHASLIDHRSSVSWHEQEVTVGSLRIPRQQCTDDLAAGVRLVSALSSELRIPSEVIDKAFVFHPVSTHEDNKPVGQVNTFRSAFYMQHAALRRETLQDRVFDTPTSAGVPRVPFDALRAAGVFEALPTSLVDLQRPRSSQGRTARRAAPSAQILHAH